MPVKLILNTIELYFDKTAKVSYVNKGNALPVLTPEIISELKSIELRSEQGNDYICRLLEKYYNK